MRRMILLAAVVALAALMLAAAPAFAANKDNDRKLDRKDVRLDKQILNNNDDGFVFVGDGFFDDDDFCDFHDCFDHNDHFCDFHDCFDRNDFFCGDGFFFNGSFCQANEQEVQSGAASQAILVEGGGANSNQCVGIQGVNNTGNAVSNTGIVQGTPFNNGFFDDNGFFDNDGFFHHNGFFDNGEVEVQDSGNFTISPTQTVSCNQQVNQSATAVG
jgi:hypothetical protein